MISITDWQKKVYQTAIDHGWWDRPACEKKAELPSTEPQGVDYHLVATKIALMHSELSEALEFLRTGNFCTYIKEGKPEGVVVELADVVIRIMDLCGGLGLDLEEALMMKSDFNETRPHKHGGKVI